VGIATVLAPEKSGMGTCFPTDLKWFDLSSTCAVTHCQVCARVVPTGFGWRVKRCMTPSPRFLRLFVALGGGGTGCHGRQWERRGLVPPTPAQSSDLPLLPGSYGGPPDAHRHTVIRQSVPANRLARVIWSTCILLERARSNWKGSYSPPARMAIYG
jgi:hypothetical protein